jgi:hypothetical protein
VWLVRIGWILVVVAMLVMLARWWWDVYRNG